MTKKFFGEASGWKLSALSFLCASITTTVFAQDRLPHYPGYDQYQKVSRELRGEIYTAGRVNVTWSEDGKSFDYQWNGKSFHYDTTTRTRTVRGISTNAEAAAPARGGRGGSGVGGAVVAGAAEMSSAVAAAWAGEALRGIYRTAQLRPMGPSALCRVTAILYIRTRMAARNRGDYRRKPGETDSLRRAYDYLWRGIGNERRHVVVAGQQEIGLLPF